MTVEGFCSDLRDFLRLESPKSAVESMDFLRLRGSGVEAVYTANGAKGLCRRRTCLALHMPIPARLPHDSLVLSCPDKCRRTCHTAQRDQQHGAAGDA